MTLPDDALARKGTPLYSGVDRFFPSALDEVARVSVVGSKQHGNDGLYDDRSKSNDDADCLRRHLRDSTAGDGMDGPVSHLAKVAWRALRHLQKDCERRGAPIAPAARNAAPPLPAIVPHEVAAAYLRDVAERDDDTEAHA